MLNLPAPIVSPDIPGDRLNSPIPTDLPSDALGQPIASVDADQGDPVIPGQASEVPQSSETPYTSQDAAGIKRVSLKVPNALYKAILDDIALKVTEAANPHAYIIDTLAQARICRQGMTEREGLITRVEAYRNKLTTEETRSSTLRRELDSAVERASLLQQQLVETQADLLEEQRKHLMLASNSGNSDFDASTEVVDLRQEVIDLSEQLTDETSRADDATDVLTLQRSENEILREHLVRAYNLPGFSYAGLENAVKDRRNTVTETPLSLRDRDATWMAIINDVCEAAAIPGLRPAQVKAQLLKVGEDSYNKRFVK